MTTIIVIALALIGLIAWRSRVPRFDEMPEPKYLQNLSAGAAIVMLSGCTTIDMTRPPPADFPALDVVIQRVDRLRCGSFGALVLACTEVNLCSGQCIITHTSETMPSWVEEHERLHCKGYDHHGSTVLIDWLARYTAAVELYRTKGEVKDNVCSP